MKDIITDKFSCWKAYSGYIYDTEKLRNSASGGAATILSEVMIAEGGMVFGVKYSKDFKTAEYELASTSEELKKFRGSKYIFPEKNVLYKNEVKCVYHVVGDLLKERKRILFIGLGCDVGALLKYLEQQGIQMETLTTVDLICHGPTLPEAQKYFIEEIEQRYKSKIISFSVKYKKKGWVPPYLRAEFENGKCYIKAFYDSDLGFAMDHYSRSSCANCQFKGNNHKADITIGDYWGIDERHSGYNALGVSVLLTKSAKGINYIEKCNQMGFHVESADVFHVLSNNRMFFESRKADVDHASFKKCLFQYGLHKTVLRERGLITTLLLKPKRLISTLMPTSLRNKLKKLIKYGE